MDAAQNERLTRIGPGTPCGALLRHYWQPAALVDEFDARLDPRMATRALKPVRLLGQDLVLFRDEAGRFGLLDRPCPHRGADLAYARHEGDGIRCPFHGWKFDVSGRCLETPAEPEGRELCAHGRQRAYPVQVRAGIVWAWLGPEGSTPAALPAFDCFAAPATHVFAFKGLWHCNWLQAVEIGIDPAHTSFLHRMLDDASLEAAYGRQFRGASAGSIAGERWPMTRIMREFARPDIAFEAAAEGLTRITTRRRIDEHTQHVRVTASLFPQTFVIPLSETITITQWHVPVDDTHTYWYSMFTSFAEALDHETMRAQRLRGPAGVTLPDYVPRRGRHDDWGYSAAEQRDRTFLGMGEDDINVHDQWAVESMGAIADRTREHLGTTDKVILHNRRLLAAAIAAVREGRRPPMSLTADEAAGLTGPDTIDCIAPADGWQAAWQQGAAAKRAGAAWLSAEASPVGA